MTITAYPLQWPEGWPRTTERKYGRFGTKDRSSSWPHQKDVTIAEALNRIHNELAALDGRGGQWNRIDPYQTVISTNLRVRRSDGEPASGQKEPGDPGAALYFKLDGKRQCIPCDSYTKVAQNLAAIAATISAIRTLERHGSGLMERAFTGFEALPDQTASGRWWHVLGVERDAPHQAIEEAYKTRRRQAHPDKPGGSHDAFVRLTEAWQEYQRERDQ